MLIEQPRIPEPILFPISNAGNVLNVKENVKYKWDYKQGLRHPIHRSGEKIVLLGLLVLKVFICGETL